MTTTQFTDGWLPLPDAVAKALGWAEGTEMNLEVVEGGILLVSPSDAQQAPRKPWGMHPAASEANYKLNKANP